jgi:hypothetical protein
MTFNNQRDGIAMKKVPITSKQIEYVAYDEQTKEMTVHYYTGEVRNYGYMHDEDFSNFLDAPNPYDVLVQLTAKASNDQILL